MGRWAYQVLACRHRTLTVISAYQVCSQLVSSISSAGDRTVHSFTTSAQQTSLLRLHNRSLSPRAAFIADLRAFLSQRRQAGSGLLLLGDFNESLDSSLSGMTALCSEFGLVDLMHQLVGHDHFATFVGGSKRIDYVICDEWVAQATVAGNYDPFKFRVKGDHRAMVLDFTMLFGNVSHHLARPSMREFSAKDRGSNCQYILAKFEYLSDHNFSNRLAALHLSWDVDEAEKLDRDFQRASFYAAAPCKQKPNVAFVKQLANLRSRKNILLHAISQFREGQFFSASLAHFSADQPDFAIPISLSECQALCRQYQSKIRAMERSAVYHRRNEQQLLYRSAIIQHDHSTAKALKHRMAAERTKAMYAKIRFARGGHRSGITQLSVPRNRATRECKSCQDWITLDTPADIEARLLAHNHEHFGEAHGTFPTVPPFSEWVDWGASTHVADLILSSKWESSALDELSKCMINHLAARTALDSVPLEITASDWIGKITIWPESTSTSPSGFHLTHSKALVAGHDLDVHTEAGADLEAKRMQLIEWQVALLNLALVNRYSYHRWQKIVNMMLLKEPGNYKIHCLRVIHLYEHNYNLLLAIKWRSLIQHCARNRLLHPAQYGAVLAEAL